MTGHAVEHGARDLSITLTDPDPYSLAETVERMQPGTRFTETDDLGRKHRLMRVFNGVIFDNGGGDRPVHYAESFANGYSIEVTHRPLATAVDAAEVERTARAWRPHAFEPADYTAGGVYDLEKLDQNARDELDRRHAGLRRACIDMVADILEAQAQGAQL
jgi:hypothetical protein